MQSEKQVKVGIVGGTGYTGIELLRLLSRHPHVHMEAITSRSDAGRLVCDVFPSLRGVLAHAFVQPDLEALQNCDVVFYATPNGIAMQQVPEILNAGIKVIDLAADFRLKDTAQWKEWYGMEHACPEFLEEAVYGLPELHREDIVGARLVANPGCYPTAVQLGFWPLIAAGVADLEWLIADVKSGVSGAGKNARTDIIFSEVAENFRAYGVDGHRHFPEIKQGLGQMAGNQDVSLTFTPHLLPMTRGIHATLYTQVKAAEVDVQALYEEYYEDEVFVDVLPAGAHPETRSVYGANTCRLAIHRPQQGNRVVILSVIDNLVKGAAGQAVQNMNIMFGLDETVGLTGVALVP